MVSLQYSATEPYVDKNGQMCIFAYDPGASNEKTWDTFTGQKIQTLDKNEYEAAQKIMNKSIWGLPGNLNFPDCIPEVKDLGEIHRTLVRFICRHCWIRDDRAPSVLANWIILSYFRKIFSIVPLVIIDGATVSGKSTLGKVLAESCYRGFTIGNFTAPATVRMVHGFHMSIFLDEALDALDKKGIGDDILNILKCMTSQSMPYIRATPNSSDGIDIFPVKTSAIIGIKGKELPEDIVNRGIRVQMLVKPDNIDVEPFYKEIFDPDESIDGEMSIREIRTKLTALKISLEIKNTHISDHHADWIRIIRDMSEKARKMLTTKTSEGWLYGISLGLKNAPKITNRQLDIAMTMLPIAMLTGSERDVMEYILGGSGDSTESDHDSFEGEVLRAFVDVLQQHIDNAPLEIFAKTTPTDMIRKITTREIAQQVNNNLHDSGDLGQWECIETRKVTHTLKTLGITYAVGVGAGGRQSTIDPTTEGFREQLQALIKRYDPVNIGILGKLEAKA